MKAERSFSYFFKVVFSKKIYSINVSSVIIFSLFSKINKDIQIYTNQCRYRLGFFFPLRLLLIRFSIFGRKDTKDYEFVYVDTHIHTCTHTYPMKFQVQKFTI